MEIFNVSNRILSGFTAGVLLICLSIPTHLAAQGNTATISGTVTDPSGAAVPDVALEVRSLDTGARQSAASDGQGRFRVPQLSLGTYEVQASKTGFETMLRRGITLNIGSEIVIDFSLQIGQAQQTIAVDGLSSQVETSSAALSNLVEPAQMRELPLNGRNFAQLLHACAWRPAAYQPGIAAIWNPGQLLGRGLKRRGPAVSARQYEYRGIL
jgi:hypothetical protein